MLLLLLMMGYHACRLEVKSTIEIHGVGFSTDLDCFHRSPLPEAPCCPVNLCSLPADVVVGGVGSYPMLLIPFPYCLHAFIYSHRQCSLGLSDAYLTAVLVRNLVDHFFLSSGTFCFTSTSSCFSVLWGLKTAFIPMGAHVFSIFSLRPAHKGCGVSSAALLLLVAFNMSCMWDMAKQTK